MTTRDTSTPSVDTTTVTKVNVISIALSKSSVTVSNKTVAVCTTVFNTDTIDARDAAKPATAPATSSNNSLNSPMILVTDKRVPVKALVSSPMMSVDDATSSVAVPASPATVSTTPETDFVVDPRVSATDSTAPRATLVTDERPALLTDLVREEVTPATVLPRLRLLVSPSSGPALHYTHKMIDALYCNYVIV